MLGANRIAQTALIVGIAACILFGVRETHRQSSGGIATEFSAQSTSGLPGPFLHGIIPGRTRLIQAILSKKTSLALFLLHNGDPEQIDAADSLGWTPLIAAAYRGNDKVAAALLSDKASTSASTRKGKTPLIYAIQTNSGKIVTALLAHGAAPNTVDKAGATPLMWAAMRGETEACSALLADGAAVNLTDLRGYTALSIATLSKSSGIIKQLLASEANPAIGAGQGDNLPLAIALDDSDSADADALINAGAPVNARTADGFTPLMLAAQNALPQSTVDLLISHGAQVDAVTSDGVTALCYACAAPAGNAAVVLDLLQHGASPLNGPNDQTTPLMYASEAGHADIVDLLLKHGARVDTVTNRGMTALHWANGEGYAAQIGSVLHQKGELE